MTAPISQELVDKVVQLRQRTGVSAYNCRKALARCEWDLDKAQEFLKEFTWDSHGFRVKRDDYNGS